MIMRCSKCGSQYYVKAGFNHNRQCYKCKDYKYQFTQTTDKNATKRAFARYLHVVGLSMNAIGRMLKVEPSIILYWVRKIVLRTYEKPTPQGEVVIELDEMLHFCAQKKQGLGLEGILSNYRRACGLGMWKSKCSSIKEMLERLQTLNVKVFFADNWEAYAELVPPELFVQTKAQMHGVERNIFRQRLGVAGFVWKTCMVSRSLRMIGLTVFLFARFHVNGSREEIWNLACNPF
jgi:IS1 family transposase/transposase-like protein